MLRAREVAPYGSKFISIRVPGTEERRLHSAEKIHATRNIGRYLWSYACDWQTET